MTQIPLLVLPLTLCQGLCSVTVFLTTASLNLSTTSGCTCLHQSNPASTLGEPDQAVAASCWARDLGRVASSTRYTRPRKFTPECCDMLTSQVRLLL